MQTDKIYVGRTSGKVKEASISEVNKILRKRDSSHEELKKSGFDPAAPDKVSENYPAIRGREQQLIEHHQKQGNCANKINGISERNKKLKFYLAAAIENLEKYF